MTTDGGRRWFRGVSRWLRPSVLAVVLICFALPFLTVSCEAPGGFGKVTAGGTTSWTGYDLLSGSEPDRTTDHLRPAAEADGDDLGWHPLVLVSWLLVLAAGVCGLVLRRPQSRRYVSVALAAAASIVLTAGVLVSRARAIELVTAQLASRELPEGHTPETYVRIGQGYTAAMVLLWIVILVDLGWWLWGSRAPRPDKADTSGV